MNLLIIMDQSGVVDFRHLPIKRNISKSLVPNFLTTIMRKLGIIKPKHATIGTRISKVKTVKFYCPVCGIQTHSRSVNFSTTKIACSQAHADYYNAIKEKTMIPFQSNIFKIKRSISSGDYKTGDMDNLVIILRLQKEALGDTTVDTKKQESYIGILE